MRYADPHLREILAGEYALGSLRGRARARFERLVERDAGLRRLVHEWQDDLAPLADETRAVAPPPRVLEAIERRIGAAREAPRGFWNRLGFWRGLSAATAAMAAVLAIATVMLVGRPPAPLAPSYVAVLQNQAAQPVLVVTAYRQPFRMKTEPIGLPAPPAGQVLQIWAEEKGTGRLRALAVAAPDAPAQLALSDEAWKLVRGAERLAVSLEPAGATPAAPTSPLIYSGLCINLKGV